jgi:hypothetical protein
MFTFTEWLNDFLVKAAGHKYIKRIPYQSGGKLRYRYIYNATHTHQGKHMMDPSHIKEGTKIMIDDTAGQEVHAHITAVRGDGMVTFTYDDGPLKGQQRTMLREALVQQLNAKHGVKEKIAEAIKKQHAIIARLKERGASDKQIEREQKRLKALGGGTDTSSMSDEELFNDPRIKPYLRVKERLDLLNALRSLPLDTKLQLGQALLRALREKSPLLAEMSQEARVGILQLSSISDEGWYSDELSDAKAKASIEKVIPLVEMSPTALDQTRVARSYGNISHMGKQMALDEIDRFKTDLEAISAAAQGAIDQGANPKVAKDLARAQAEKVLNLYEQLADKRVTLASAGVAGRGGFSVRQQQKRFAEYDKKEDNLRNAVKQAVRSFTRVTPKKEATPSSTELTGVMGDLASRLQGHEFTLSEGTKGKVEIDQDEGRVNLRFEGKPTAEERTRLKERGVSFKWSPSRGVWTRKLTREGLDGAIRVSGLKFK